jgi:phosphoribosylformylglycinamidine synthase
MLNFEREKGVQEVVLKAAREGILTSAHDCSEGGLAVALAESCILSPASMGAMMTIAPEGIRMDAFLFSESQSRIIVTVKEPDLKRLLQLIEEASLPYSMLGITGGMDFDLTVNNGSDRVVHLSVEEMKEAHSKGLSKYFE